MVTCPTCGGPSVFAPNNKFRPFCSERCRGVDLGAWASDGYRVASGSADDGDTEAEPGAQPLQRPGH